MEQLLADFRARERVPGVAVCTFDSAGTTELACSGVGDVESGTPVRADTMFRIYSVAKLLTAAAVLTLVRRGLVELDAPLDGYLGSLRRRAGAPVLTVRQALSHTGGLVPDSLTWARLGRNDDDLATDILRDYSRAFSFAAPGRHYGYCNAGFNLTAVLIERLTGRPFAEAMRELLFDPIGMPVTTHDPVLAMTYPLAQHHELVGDELKVIHRPLAGSKWLAGSQCYSTVTELARFGQWLLTELRAGAAGGIDQPIADLRLDVGTHYGLGCYLTEGPDGRVVLGHEGFFEGSWVKLALDPTGDRGIVWLDNRGDELRDARYQVIDRLLPGLLPAPDGRPGPVFAAEPPRGKASSSAAPSGAAPSGKAPSSAAPSGDASRGIASGNVAGHYQRLGSPALRIEADGADLLVSHDGRQRRLHPFGRGIWRGRASGADTGPWRPHAGSAHVCLGAAVPDADGTRVVHLNAIPYRGDGD